MTRRHAPLVLLLLTLGASAAPVAFDPALVTGEVVEWGGLRAPYLARFEKDGRRLDYVAARHEVSRAAATMRLIDASFARGVDFVVIEGVPRGMGESSESFLAYARAHCDDRACPAGEPAYAASTAAARGVPFVGGEPGDEEVAPAVAARGFTPRDLLAFYFVRHLPQYRREKIHDPARFPELFARVRRDHHVPGAEGFSYADFLDWYRAGNGKPFDPAAFDDDEAAPKSKGVLLSQRVSAAVDAVRNRFTMRVVADALSARRRVLVVYGASHFDMERAALVKALGAPAYSRLDRNGDLVAAAPEDR